MSSSSRWNKSTLIFGGAALWGLLLVGCVMVERTVVAPPQVAGATYVGSKKCAECHDDQTAHFKTAAHADLALKDDKGKDIGCEACHGAGSVHVKAGGGKGTIVNPGKSPEACFQCHTDKRGEFSLPNSHPVMAGRVTCSDCHEPHSGGATKGHGARTLEAENETCTKCHVAQKGPFVFPHNAFAEGCTACHNPHGTVNQKMLVARNANLCLKCHLEHPAVVGDGKILVGGEDHRTRLQNGTCWVAGCHEAVHGSNASAALRY
jgi:predicted CXXCH cytochrome family protein